MLIGREYIFFFIENQREKSEEKSSSIILILLHNPGDFLRKKLMNWPKTIMSEQQKAAQWTQKYKIKPPLNENVEVFKRAVSNRNSWLLVVNVWRKGISD